MATVDKTSYTKGGSWNGSGIFSYFNRLTIPAATATGEIYKLFSLSAGERVMGCAYKMVQKGDATTPTCDIGITGVQADYIVDGGSLAGAAGAVVIADDEWIAGAETKFFMPFLTAADTVDLLYLNGGAGSATDIIVDVELVTMRIGLCSTR